MTKGDVFGIGGHKLVFHLLALLSPLVRESPRVECLGLREVSWVSGHAPLGRGLLMKFRTVTDDGTYHILAIISEFAGMICPLYSSSCIE